VKERQDTNLERTRTMGHHKVIEKRHDKVMERSMTRLWEKRHDKVMERSMTRL